MEDIIALSGKAMQFHVVEASRVGGGGETSYKNAETLNQVLGTWRRRGR